MCFIPKLIEQVIVQSIDIICSGKVIMVESFGSGGDKESQLQPILTHLLWFCCPCWGWLNKNYMYILMFGVWSLPMVAWLNNFCFWADHSQLPYLSHPHAFLCLSHDCPAHVSPSPHSSDKSGCDDYLYMLYVSSTIYIDKFCFRICVCDTTMCALIVSSPFLHSAHN